MHSFTFRFLDLENPEARKGLTDYLVRNSNLGSLNRRGSSKTKKKGGGSKSFSSITLKFKRNHIHLTFNKLLTDDDAR